MNMPTEPGHYWCKFAPDADWTVAEVWCADRKGRCVATCNAWEALVQNVAAWGERIPDNDRLKALKALAERQPLGFTDDTEDIGYRCFHCSQWASESEDFQHADHCPWQRAQEKREGASDDTR